MLCVRVPGINQPPLAAGSTNPLCWQMRWCSPRSIPPSHVAGTQQLLPFTTDVCGAAKCLKIFLLIKGALRKCYIHMYFPLFFNLLLHQLLKKKKAERRKEGSCHKLSAFRDDSLQH